MKKNEKKFVGILNFLLTLYFKNYFFILNHRSKNESNRPRIKKTFKRIFWI